MRLSIELTLRSDTCFGSGVAAWSGDVDVEVERDAHTGLPRLHGRTIKGVLLEELEVALRALEPERRGPWHDEAERLFGRSGAHDRPALLSFHDGRLPLAVVSEVERQQRPGFESAKRWSARNITRALTTVRFQTKIDPDSGAAEPRSLRATRLWRAGLRLRCPVTVDGELSVAGRALLAACTTGVRRVGLHRNEGWGRVSARVLTESGEEVTARWLAGLTAGPTPSTARVVEQQLAPESASDDRHVVTYRLRLTAPALVAASGGDPSAVSSLPFISGSSILGAMAGRWLMANPGSDPSESPAFRRCFLDGTVRWLHAYPCDRRGHRLVPAPRTLVVSKLADVAKEIGDRASPRFDEGFEPFQSLKEGHFVWFSHDAERPEARLRRPGMEVRLHHQRDREKGRSDSGEMFSYVALRAGEPFVGHVLCESQGDAELVRTLLEAGSIRIGRSRSAGYGGHAELEELKVSSAKSWRETEVRPTSDEEPLVLTLLSDFLGRSALGEPDPGALLDDLATALELDRAALIASRSSFGRRAVSGYVSKWRMPRPVHGAVAAGSVVVIERARPRRELIDELRWSGLGERRAEGFGRIAVDLHGWPRLAIQRERRPSALRQASAARESVDELLFLQRNLLSQALSEALERCAARHVSDAASSALPPTHLISKLRGLLRAASGPDELEQLREALSPKAKKTLGRCQVQSAPVDKWLVSQVKRGDEEWPKWLQQNEVKEVVRGTGLSLNLLDADASWRVVVDSLDTFLEGLRQASATARRERTAGGKKT